MAGKIFYGSKEENNQRRQEEFLSLAPSERLRRVLKMWCQMPKVLKNSKHPRESNNFIVSKHD